MSSDYKKDEQYEQKQSKLSAFIQKHPRYKNMSYEIKSSATLDVPFVLIPLAFMQNGDILTLHKNYITSELTLSKFYQAPDFIMSEHDLIDNITINKVNTQTFSQSMLALDVKEIYLDKYGKSLWYDLNVCSDPFYRDEFCTPIVKSELSQDCLVVMKSPALEIMLKSPAISSDSYHKLKDLAGGHDIVLVKGPAINTSYETKMSGHFKLNAPLKNEDLFKVHALFKAPQYATFTLMRTNDQFNVTLIYELTSNDEGLVHITTTDSSTLAKTRVKNILCNKNLKLSILGAFEKLNLKDEFNNPIVISSVNLA